MKKPAKPTNPKKLSLRFEPIRMTFGFAIGAAMIASKWSKPGAPTAAELAAMTKRLPELFPRPWTLKEAKYALDHHADLIEVTPNEPPRPHRRNGS